MLEISKFDFRNPRFKLLIERQNQVSEEVIRTVSAIVEEVRVRRDEALFKYMLKYDNIDLSAEGPRVSDEEIEHACNHIDPNYADALKQACDNIFKYHQHQLQNPYKVAYPHDVIIERRVKPIDKVGVCVPSGVSPLSSSLYMNLIPALVAGVPDLYIISSPKKSKINETILFTANYLGVRKIFKISGAQGVAALAYGTESIPSVDKIVGPGNIYVQTAKKLLYGTVGIDSYAGPSEIAIISDNSTPTDFIAADLLSQAEHGTGFEASVVFCLTEKKAEEIQACVTALVSQHGLEARVKKSLATYGNIFIVDSLTQAADAVNFMAPEHVEVMTRDQEEIAKLITNAGAIFIGRYCPESVGDYFCGTNHVLPTGGTARFSSGLTVADFTRSYSIVRYTEKALRSHSSAIQTLAHTEAMTAHMLSVSIRTDKKGVTESNAKDL